MGHPRPWYRTGASPLGYAAADVGQHARGLRVLEDAQHHGNYTSAGNAYNVVDCKRMSIRVGLDYLNETKKDIEALCARKRAGGGERAGAIPGGSTHHVLYPSRPCGRSRRCAGKEYPEHFLHDPAVCFETLDVSRRTVA